MPDVPKACKRNWGWDLIRETDLPGGDMETETWPTLTRPPMILLGEVTASEAGRLREVGTAAQGHTARPWWS